MGTQLAFSAGWFQMTKAERKNQHQWQVCLIRKVLTLINLAVGCFSFMIKRKTDDKSFFSHLQRKQNRRGPGKLHLSFKSIWRFNTCLKAHKLIHNIILYQLKFRTKCNVKPFWPLGRPFVCAAPVCLLTCVHVKLKRFNPLIYGWFSDPYIKVFREDVKLNLLIIY